MKTTQLKHYLLSTATSLRVMLRSKNIITTIDNCSSSYRTFSFTEQKFAHYKKCEEHEDEKDKWSEEKENQYFTPYYIDEDADPFNEKHEWMDEDNYIVTRSGLINLREHENKVTHFELEPSTENFNIKKREIMSRCYEENDKNEEVQENRRCITLNKTIEKPITQTEAWVNKVDNKMESRAEEGNYRYEEEVEEHKQVYKLSNEQLHMRKLEERRSMMEHNYSTYEEYIVAEFGNSDQTENCNDKSTSVSMNNESILNQPIEDVNTKINDANYEHSSNNENITLPHFMFECCKDEKNCRAEDIIDENNSVDVNKRNSNNGISNVNNEEQDKNAEMIEKASSTITKQFTLSIEESKELEELLLLKLGPHHGHRKLPLTDPINWNCESVILFLTIFEQPLQLSGDSDSNYEDKVMNDVAMLQAFEIAKVDGKKLLTAVTPPTLFKIMRRWHNRRQIALKELMQLQTRSAQTQNLHITNSTSNEENSIISKHKAKLDDAVYNLSSQLIKDTIISCYTFLS